MSNWINGKKLYYLCERYGHGPNGSLLSDKKQHLDNLIDLLDGCKSFVRGLCYMDFLNDNVKHGRLVGYHHSCSGMYLDGVAFDHVDVIKNTNGCIYVISHPYIRKDKEYEQYITKDMQTINDYCPGMDWHIAYLPDDTNYNRGTNDYGQIGYVMYSGLQKHSDKFMEYVKDNIIV